MTTVTDEIILFSQFNLQIFEMKLKINLNFRAEKKSVVIIKKRRILVAVNCKKNL